MHAGQPSRPVAAAQDLSLLISNGRSANFALPVAAVVRLGQLSGLTQLALKVWTK